MEHEAKARLKQRVIEEFRAYWALTFYLFLFLGAFADYRRLILAEVGTSYLHYGVALVEALVIAKVVLVGRMLRIGRRFENRALIVPVVVKTILFAGLVIVFTVVEHLVEGWIHRQGLMGGLRELGNLGIYELAARVLILVVAFVPIFAFAEVGRVIGGERLAAMFFSKPGAAQHPTA